MAYLCNERVQLGLVDDGIFYQCTFSAAVPDEYKALFTCLSQIKSAGKSLEKYSVIQLYRADNFRKLFPVL